MFPQSTHLLDPAPSRPPARELFRGEKGAGNSRIPGPFLLGTSTGGYARRFLPSLLTIAGLGSLRSRASAVPPEDEGAFREEGLMTREESETVIRRLVAEWVELRGVTQGRSEA